MTDIEKLKELEAKATPGRWQVGFNDGSGLGEHGTGYSVIAPEVAEDETVVFSGDNDGCLLGIRKKEDAEFMAAAKNALPALLASLASKDAENAELRKWQERESDTQDALQAIGEEFGVHGGEPRTDGVRRVLTELRARAEAAESRLTTALAALGEARDEVRDLMRAYVSTIEAGRDRIIDLGGQCDPVDVMEAADPALRKARATIAKLNALEGNSDD